MPEEKKPIFQTLREIDLKEKHKKKGNLNYLPWATAWATVKTIYPDATYRTIRDYDDKRYHVEGNYAYVETEVTIENETLGETLAIMDMKNQPILAENITSTNVDKSLKRCLTKNLGLFGLDLNLWEGEELSDEAKEIKDQKEEEEKKARAALRAEIDKVVEYGNKLIEAGVDKKSLTNCVAKFNGGNGNPSSIKSIEDCSAVLAGLQATFDKSLTAEPTPAAATPATTSKTKSNKGVNT